MRTALIFTMVVASAIVLVGCPSRIRNISLENRFKVPIYFAESGDIYWEVTKPGERKLYSEKFYRTPENNFIFYNANTRREVGRLALGADETAAADDGTTLHIVAKPAANFENE